MAYIYKKVIGNKEYYYLRASARKNGKIIVKDIKYLGSDPDAIKDQIKNLPKKYSEEIRKTHKTINSFLEVNRYLMQAKLLKLKSDPYLKRDNIEMLEACKLHYNQIFLKKDLLTKNEIIKNFIIEFAFNTASLEGNTITLLQAHKLLGENTTPKDKTLREIYDIQNTEKVFLKIYENPKKEINHELIQVIHSDLLENIDSRKGYRIDDVRVYKANFKATPAPYVKADMDALIKWHNSQKNQHPFVLAVVFHHKFEKIHPFMDGNGRTGRMLLNLILLKNNYPPLIIRKKNRVEYLDALRKADNSSLTSLELENYETLIELASKELTDNYWNLFL